VHIGSENRKKVLWASVLGGLALFLVAYQLIGSMSSPVTAAQPATSASGTKPRTHLVHGKERPIGDERLDPTLDLRRLAETEQTKYTGSGRNIFVAQVDIPQPIAKVEIEPTGPIGPPPPPPPINLKFFGFANKPGEPKKAFLSQGEDVFIAVEGDIVDRRYKIIHINPTSVEVEDVLYNNRQNIPLTQAPGAG